MNATGSFRMGGLLMAASVVGLAVGCGEPAGRTVATGPTTVVVSKPLEQEVRDSADFPGRTDAAMSVDLRARVNGYLSSFNFKVGEEVKQGALLFEIDPREYQAVLQRAQADVLASEASLKLATADLERAKKLLPKGAVSQEDFDKYVATRAEAEASLASAKARVDQAALNVEFTKITAPFAGDIGRNLIDIGNLVSADVTELANIVTVDPIFVYFDVDERTMLRLQRLLMAGKIRGAKDNTFPVMVRLADENDHTHEATVNFVNNRVDPNTGTIQLRAVLANPIVANGRRRFIGGLYVGVRVPIGEPYKALLVSERALMTQQGEKYLYVVSDKNEVVYRPVKLGILQNGLRVIEQGLGPGERVIVSGLQLVRPGVVVNPKPGPMRPEPPQSRNPQQPDRAGAAAKVTK